MGKSFLFGWLEKPINEGPRGELEELDEQSARGAVTSIRGIDIAVTCVQSLNIDDHFFVLPSLYVLSLSFSLT